MYRSLYNLTGLLNVVFLYPLAEWKLKRSITPKLHILRAEASLPFERRKAQATETLANILEHAGRTVPYYREIFAARGFVPSRIRKDAGYLEELPYLTKSVLLEQGERLISEPYAHAIKRRQKTGSSTGPAATVCYDQEGLDWTAAQNILMLEWGGKRRHNREVHLSTRFPQFPSKKDMRFDRVKCFLLNRRNVYTDGFGEASLEVLLDDLRRAKARVVQGHPSSLYALARYLKATGKNERGLFEIFVSTGEMLTDAQREMIEEQLAVRVSNRYGACEFGVMAQERMDGPKGQLMVSDSLVWPEISEDGELVFTGLRNMVMPLIRYRMGDTGCLEERQDGWWLSALTGRIHDAVAIDGMTYPTHYIQDILERCGPISDFQILVRNETAVEFRLVVPDEYWEQTLAQVRLNFPTVPARRISADELVFVGIRGKFSYLLRECV